MRNGYVEFVYLRVSLLCKRLDYTYSGMHHCITSFEGLVLELYILLYTLSLPFCCLQCIDKGFEGLVLKSAEEPYVCGERMKGWLKMKPEYAEGAFETLDCVIVGGTYADSGGAAKRGKITRFLLAVADDTSRRPPEEGKGGLGLPKVRIVVVTADV